MNNNDHYIKKYIYNNFIESKFTHQKHDKEKEDNLKSFSEIDFSIRSNVELIKNNFIDNGKILNDNLRLNYIEIFKNNFIIQEENSFHYGTYLLNEKPFKYDNIPNVLFLDYFIRFVLEIQSSKEEFNIDRDVIAEKTEINKVKIKDIELNQDFTKILTQNLNPDFLTKLNKNCERFYLKSYNGNYYVIKIETRGIYKNFIPAIKYGEHSFANLEYAVPVTDDGKYNFITSGDIKKAEIIIFTDCIDLALINQRWLNQFNNHDIVWISYSEVWNPLEECDFEILKDKKVYYLLAQHSKLEHEEIYEKADLAAKLFIKNNIDFKFISLLKPDKLFITEEQYWSGQYSLLQDYNDFKIPKGYNFGIPLNLTQFEKICNSRIFLNPYIKPNSLTKIIGRRHSGKTLFAMNLAFAIQNSLQPFKGWKKGTIKCHVLYLSFSKWHLKESINKKFIERVFAKRIKNKQALFSFNHYFVNNYSEAKKLIFNFSELDDKLIILDGYVGDENLYLKLQDLGWTVIVVDARDFKNEPLENVDNEILGKINSESHIKNRTKPLSALHKNSGFDNTIYLVEKKDNNNNSLNIKVKVLSNYAQNSQFNCSLNFEHNTFSRLKSTAEKKSFNKRLSKSERQEIIDYINEAYYKGLLPLEKIIAERFQISLAMVKKLKREAGVTKKRNKEGDYLPPM
ncbi:hypothetical protein AAEX28_04910 [Lentisphaerota bacterium WC36G]|nr:hypothetical protein LJT99_07765 [Lentisphaerae bacterium WC36]